MRLASAHRRGDHGGDLLLLGARLDAFLRRPASVSELDTYFTAAGMIAGDRDGLAGFFAGDNLMVTDGSSHEFVTLGTAAAESFREALDRSRTGLVDLGGDLRDDPLARVEVPIASGEGAQRLSLRVEAREGARATYLVETLTDGAATDVDTAEDLAGVLQAVFGLGWNHGREETDAREGIDPPPDPLALGIGLSVSIDEGDRRLSLVVGRSTEPGTRYDATLLRQGGAGEERLDSAEASDASALLWHVFDMGRTYGFTENAQVLPDEHGADLAAVAALRPGESWTRVLHDARETVSGAEDESVRVVVERDFREGFFSVFAETFSGGEWLWSEGTNPSYWPDRVDARSMDDVAACLAFHRLMARSWCKPPVSAKRNEEEAVDPAVAAVLALAVGETWTEERWGPYLVPGAEIRHGRYPTESMRIVAERRSRNEERDPFVLHAEASWCGDAWKGDDLGFDSTGRGLAFEMTADADSLGTCLAAFRALLDHEGRERETDEAAIAEREAKGITDEHLRMGTLSERTLAELAQDAKEAS